MAMRSGRRLVAVLLAGLLMLSVFALSSCKSGASKTSNYDEAIKAARAGIWEDINSGKASSGQAAILVDRAVIYSETFGMIDRAAGTPVDTTTLFNSGSIGKLYCATAVMKLVDDGKVELDSPVVRYLPDFKMADPRYKDITVRMLLDHQSGLPGTTAANDFGYKVNPDFYSQLYENLGRSHLKADPGYSAPYCNDGFTLAEMLVAKVSGRKYIDYLTDQVLTPLSLTRTWESIGARPDAGVAVFYDPETGKKYPPEAVSLLGAGGLSTTAEELVLFGDSFTRGGPRVLSQKSVDEMTTAHPSTWAKEAVKQVGLNPELAYGLGLDAVSLPDFEKQGIKVIAKGGDTQDFHSELLVVPEKRIAVAVMEAGHGSSAAAIALSVLENVLVAKNLMKKEPTPVTVPTAPQPLPPGYESFAGLYDSGSDLDTIEVDTGANTVSITGSSGKPITFVYNGGRLYDPEGNIMALVSVGGRTALIKSVIGLWMSSAEMIPAATDPKSLRIDVDGSMWLRRNARPWQSIQQAGGDVLELSTDTRLPGYVILGGSLLVESPTFAGMTSSVIRDLTEMNLIDRNGQTWMWISDMLFSPISDAATLDMGEKSITIGKEGYDEWLKAGPDLVLKVKKPSADRVVVFGPEGESIYDSEIDSGEVYVPAGSLIELAGSAGDTFTVSATAPAGD